MKIAGLQKMTLLDYPGRVACTVFLPGCNFRCPFCHNSELLDGTAEPVMDDSELLSFLEKRRGLLDGVCITGGEPTLQKELPRLLADIKAMGYPVKLDTNGCRPDVLKDLVNRGLVDYVAMDVKNDPRRYAETAGVAGLALGKIEESLGFLLADTVDYELRTTVVEPLHDADSFRNILKWLQALSPKKKAKRYFLQPFTDRDTVLFSGLKSPEAAQLAQFRELLQLHCENVGIRGL